MSHKALPVVLLGLEHPLKEYSIKELEDFDIFRHEIRKLGDYNPLNLSSVGTNDNDAVIIYGDVDFRNSPKESLNKLSFDNVIIDGDFRCSKHKKIIPFMVNGTFDCSNNKLYQGESIEFPRYATKINCVGCVDNFDILSGKIPQDLEKLIINIKIDLDEHIENLKSFLLFREMYPNVKVSDKSGKLYNDILKKLIDDKKKKTEQVNTEKKEISKSENKTNLRKEFDKNTDISKKDVVKYLVAMDEFSNVPDIEKLVSIIFASNDNGIKTYSKTRHGTDTQCVNRDDLNNIINELKSLLAKKENEKIEVKPVVTKNTEPKVNTSEKIHNNELKPDDIKKYISKKLYAGIKKYARNDRLIPILEEINAVNKNPLKMKKNDSISIIVDDKEVVAKNVEREKTNVLAQSFDGNKSEDIKRIIWVVYKNYKNELVIKCFDYDLEHSQKYKTKLNKAKEFGNENIFTEQDEKDCFEIGKLLKSLYQFDLAKENIEKKQPQKTK